MAPARSGIVSRSASHIEASWSVSGPLRHAAGMLRSSMAKHGLLGSHHHSTSCVGDAFLEEGLLEPGQDYFTPTEKAVLYIQDAYDNQVRVQPRNTVIARLAHAMHLRLQLYARVSDLFRPSSSSARLSCPSWLLSICSLAFFFANGT